MWSEVLDSDAFAAFEEAGDIFDSGTAKKLHDHVYAAGGSCDPAELYTAFRGRLPTADGLLKRRGLSEDAASIAVLPEAYSDVMGHAGAIVLHPDGTFEAGHDPRADGGAASV